MKFLIIKAIFHPTIQIFSTSKPIFRNFKSKIYQNLQKSVENDAESDADDEEIEDEEEMDDEEEEIEISDEEEEEIDDEAEEEAVVEEEASEAVEKDPKLKASKNSMDRIMTQEDFKNIKAYQLKKQLIGEKRLKKQMGKGRSQADERIVDEMAEKLELFVFILLKLKKNWEK